MTINLDQVKLTHENTETALQKTKELGLAPRFWVFGRRKAQEITQFFKTNEEIGLRTLFNLPCLIVDNPPEQWHLECF